MLRDTNKYSEDNLDYSTKKKNNIELAKLTKDQMSVISKKKKIADMTGQDLDVEQILNNPGFKALGDKKDPATKKDIEEFIK